MDDFSPLRLVLIGEHYKEFELWLKDKFKSIPEDEKFDVFKEEAESFRVLLKQNGWEETETWVKNELVNLTADGFLLDKPYIDFAKSLKEKIVSEINSLPIVCLPDLPPRISRSSLENVREMFEEDIFNSLPSIARRDFQEAANCYLHGQETAAVFLAFRATEATLREYCCRMLGKETVSGTWESLVSQLKEIAPQNLLTSLKTQKDQRNEFAHPQRIAQREYALRQIDNAFGLSSEMVQNWRDSKKTLAIGLPFLGNLTDKFEFAADLSLACFILEKSFNGIGRVTLLSDESYDPNDYDYVLGMENGEFSRAVDCISKELVYKRGIDKYNSLVNFIESIIELPNENIVDSDMPEQTLQPLLYIICEKAADFQRFLSDVRNLFEFVQIKSLDPFDKYFAHDLPERYSSLVNQIKTEFEEIETAWRGRFPLKYEGAQTVIIEANKTRFEKLRKRAFNNGYELVILNDPSRSASISLQIKKGSRVNLQKLHKPFTGKTSKKFNCTTSKLESEEKISVTTKKIRDILTESEIPEVREEVDPFAIEFEQTLKDKAEHE